MCKVLQSEEPPLRHSFEYRYAFDTLQCRLLSVHSEEVMCLINQLVSAHEFACVTYRGGRLLAW